MLGGGRFAAVRGAARSERVVVVAVPRPAGPGGRIPRRRSPGGAAPHPRGRWRKPDQKAPPQPTEPEGKRPVPFPSPARNPASPQPAARLRALYETLAATYGPQHWWPSQSPLETIVGACLTQGTAWTAVERSLANLRDHGLLDFHALRNLPIDELRALIRPSGFMQRTAGTLHALLDLIHTEYQASIENFARTPLATATALLPAACCTDSSTAGWPLTRV